jgi:hypothetical protein
MARPENPTPPTTAAECRAILADQISKSNPNSRRSIDATRLLDSYEEEARRNDKQTENALREKEADASLQKSKQAETDWKEKETDRLREVFLAAAETDRRRWNEERRDLSAQVSTLRDQLKTRTQEKETAAAEHTDEIARLQTEHQSEISQWREKYDALQQYDISVAERTPPTTAEDCWKEITALSAHNKTLSPKYQTQEIAQALRRMRLLLDTHTELTAAEKGEPSAQ